MVYICPFYQSKASSLRHTWTYTHVSRHTHTHIKSHSQTFSRGVGGCASDGRGEGVTLGEKLARPAPPAAAEAVAGEAATATSFASFAAFFPGIDVSSTTGVVPCADSGVGRCKRGTMGFALVTGVSAVSCTGVSCAGVVCTDPAPAPLLRAVAPPRRCWCVAGDAVRRGVPRPDAARSRCSVRGVCRADGLAAMWGVRFPAVVGGVPMGGVD